MSALNFNLRGISPALMSELKQQAEKQHASVNALILNCIEKSFGYSHPICKPTYHDLDHLAGTWTQADLNEFTAAAQSFEAIDKELWK